MNFVDFNNTPELKFIPKNKNRDNKRKVILTIFAGRKYYLEILFKYLDFLINHEKLHEVHLWNYTRSNIDNVWLKSLNKNKYIIYEPKNKKAWQWEEYYEYYCNQAEYNENDIIIKCDDDIVFIDIECFDNFINQIDDKHIYFPNIVNNDVCAYIQSKNKVHKLLNNIRDIKRGDTSPLSNLYTSYDKAKLIHEDFLSSNSKNYTISGPNINWNSRISINFYGSEFSYIKKIYSLFVNRKNRISDEGFFADICKDNQFNHVIVPNFVVSHFSFGPQNSLCLANEFLINYYILADRQLKTIANQRKITIYGAWCDDRNELWIKKKLNGKGVSRNSITILHSYNNKIIEIPGLDFPGEDITSIKCSNLSEARLKYGNYIDTNVL